MARLARFRRHTPWRPGAAEPKATRALAWEHVLGAAWPGREPPRSEQHLDLAVALARANQVQGGLARRHPDALAGELAEVAGATAAFDAALAEATVILRGSGIDPVLIKCIPGADHVYSNFDLVVGARLADAVAALSDWGVRTSGHPLEHSKVLVHPAKGPAAHLHQEASWWDVPVVDGDTLRSRAFDTGSGLIAAPVDQLRIWVAHALFQNLSVDLSELLALRPLLDPELVEQAAAFCRLEGWDRGFRRVIGVVQDLVEALDAGATVPAPVRLPLAASASLSQHVLHLARTGRPGPALREAVLRVPLLIAKARRVRLTQRVAPVPPGVAVIGLSGPDGSGKSTLLRTTSDLAAARGLPVETSYLFGCVMCRELRLPDRLHRALSSPGMAALDGTEKPVRRSAWQRLHAAMDTAELAVRLELACRRAARTARRTGTRVVVLTDRTPLDTLVKHDPDGDSPLTRGLRRLAGRYAAIVLLDADSKVLAGRDGEHASATLERARHDYSRWSRSIAGVLPRSTETSSPRDLARTVLDEVLAAGASPPHAGSSASRGSFSNSA